MRRYTFDIDQRVKVLASDGSGFYGTITDRLYSNATKEWYYKVRFDGQDLTSAALYPQSELEEAKDEVTYHYGITLAKDVVIAVLTEQVGDGEPKFVARGHGHIIHDGVLGFAQASAYALKRIWWELNPREGDENG